MSRHKLVKTLNFANELDDFDGGANYNDSEEADGSAPTSPVLTEDTQANNVDRT